jgi:colicin import membrane protein
MHAHSPGSYSLSLMLHGVIVVAILLSAHIFNDARKNTGAQIIELVASPGDNYMGTVAPALGAPDVPDIAFPPPPAASPSPPPPVVEPIVTPASNPIIPVPPDALIVPPAKKISPPKTPPKTTPETQVKNMTWDEFQKQNANKNKNMPSGRPAPNKQTNAPAKPITPPKIGQGLSKGVLGDVGTAAGAGGTALAAAERDQMDGYFALLAQRIREAQQKPEGLGSELTVRIEFQVYASGAIGAVKVIRSSGNRAFDDSVLKAIRAVRPIGARPDGKSGSKTADFRMREEE